MSHLLLQLEIAHLKFIAVLIQRCNSRKLCTNKLAGGVGVGFAVKYPSLHFLKIFIFIVRIERGEWNGI